MPNNQNQTILNLKSILLASLALSPLFPLGAFDLSPSSPIMFWTGVGASLYIIHGINLALRRFSPNEISLSRPGKILKFWIIIYVWPAWFREYTQ